MNQYDSEKMVDVLNAKEALVKTDVPEEADIILFNTCSIREKAQEKVFSDLGRMRPLKEKNPNLIIGVGGCVASQEGQTIIKRAPYVDVVFGPQTLHRLPDLIETKKQLGIPQMDISFPEIEKFDHLPPARVEGAAAFVSIMEGCSKYCSFCVVPYTRGEEVSRPFEDVLVEIAGLVQQGVKEIHLLGQNVNAYRGKMPDGEYADFALLLEYVHEVDGVERIRFTTSHPKEFTQRLIDCYAHLPKLVSHLHLPVQAGSDRILAAMKRGHTVLEYKSIIRKLRAVRPDLCLSSDFIIGFPGETAADFEATMKLIEELDFDASFSFIYSRRPGTPAANLTDELTAQEKHQRLNRLQKRIDERAFEVNQTMVGTIQRVLVENVARKNAAELVGRTDNNRIVLFEADARLVGQFVRVEITKAEIRLLRGQIETTEAVLL